MRGTTRLLATVKPSRFLEPGAPTGLTGLFTHPAPRPTLIYLYSSTLEKLKALPSSSVYRQSTEALTNHRLKIVQSTIPEGLEEWKARSKKRIEENPEVFDPAHPKYTGDLHKTVTRNGISFIETRIDGQTRANKAGNDNKAFGEGTRTAAERADQDQIFDEKAIADTTRVEWEPEPPLNVDQISDIESQIGAGLLEEVIQVAEGELKLVDTMIESKVWEELEEKPVEGQWTYFSRDTATQTTQTPPQK